MEKNQMYFWLMISDMITTVILETIAGSGVNAETVTKEDWLAVSGANVARRKAAADKIRQHGKEV